jgi:hypothetical protein
VDTPYLVGGKKFDLRIYALVTSYNPLRIYLYRCVIGLDRIDGARSSRASRRAASRGEWASA